jgi:hypothetical protein
VPARADVFTAIGKFLGNPLGGFIDSATAPTLQNAEGTADRVVADIDGHRVALANHEEPTVLAEKRDATALAASHLGLYAVDGDATRGPLGLSLLAASSPAPPATSAKRDEVAAANDAVRLRLL